MSTTAASSAEVDNERKSSSSSSSAPKLCGTKTVYRFTRAELPRVLSGNELKINHHTLCCSDERTETPESIWKEFDRGCQELIHPECTRALDASELDVGHTLVRLDVRLLSVVGTGLAACDRVSPDAWAGAIRPS